MSIFLRKIDSAVAVPVYTISENAIAAFQEPHQGPPQLRFRVFDPGGHGKCTLQIEHRVPMHGGPAGDDKIVLFFGWRLGIQGRDGLDQQGVAGWGFCRD
jgi:hypothetical protein